ncbi:lactonase family protein [Breznakia pachnodae]|uniref:6-phosphogluconolactonase (Cycloisomerase 2 family) n=1 Tax=Breznakia pachnodae TaxID=265178 RepID=A0ABU0E830_9FIRM|nr:beta-propeller fold lactonase family protein [Breznakia pachnodae]MDQ0363059.1 6-phosphogluconolactonase (cycloisomerase 2 family) [Breznakia pachnodae]
MNQDKSIEMMICYYGKEGYSKSGIMYCRYQPELQTFEIIDDARVGGKINFILWNKEQVLVPVADGNQTGIKVFSLENDKLNESRFLNTEYFYSYGVMKNKDYGYFSSFSSGVDAIIDFHKDSEIDTIEYEGGKSHYINLLNDGRIYALDNGNDMLYVYQDNNKELEIEKKISFGNESPRLMPLHPNGKRAYLLMQRTNQIVVFDTEDFDELQRIDIPGATIDVDFCGGIFVDKSGTYVCATIRVKNEIALFKIDKNGLLIYLDSQACGEMPRDLTSEQEYMFITCSYSNRIEVMKIENDKLVKLDTYLEIDQPITFANKENI